MMRRPGSVLSEPPSRFGSLQSWIEYRQRLDAHPEGAIRQDQKDSADHWIEVLRKRDASAKPAPASSRRG